jgi:hypothetical protein
VVKKDKIKKNKIEAPIEPGSSAPQEEQREVDPIETAAPIILGGLRRVKVTQEELMKLQDERKLVGYDPATQEAIIN